MVDFRGKALVDVMCALEIPVLIRILPLSSYLSQARQKTYFVKKAPI